MKLHLIGKFIGAIIGYMVGGPFGLVIGLLLGHALDAGYWRFSNTSKLSSQEIFFRATFLIMGNIAKADGRVSQDEITYARKVMHQMQLTEAQQQIAIQYFNAGKEANFIYDTILIELKQACYKHPELLRLFMEIQLHIAHADRQLTTAEKKILSYLCECLGFNLQEFPNYNFNDFVSDGEKQQKTAAEIISPYQILQISPNAQNKEVIKAYRRLVNQYHPDKLISKGLPEEMLQFATQKTQAIRAAYEEICKLRGM